MIANLQIFGAGVRRTHGVESCFRWIADIRDRDYSRQPRALTVEVNGSHMRIPYVANEADTYISRCFPLRRLGNAPRIEARFRATYGDTTIDETQSFDVRVPEPGAGFTDCEGHVVGPAKHPGH